MSAFFAKSHYFLAKIVPLLKAIVWKQFVLFSDFVRKKVTVNENVSFTDYAPGIRFLDSSKLAINWRNDNDVTICWHDVIVKFWRCFVSLIKFSYWSKFHVNIITGSRAMTVYFYKGLTRNMEIGNTPAWVLPNIWRLRRDRDTNFGTDVSNEKLLDAAKCQGDSFYGLWVIKRKPIGVEKLPSSPKLPSTTPRFWLSLYYLSIIVVV